MMQSKLPDNKRTRTIADMKVGESGYAVPWAMFADEDSKLWLKQNFTIHDGIEGTVSMKVTREEDGYRCDITKSKDQSWLPRPIKEDEWMVIMPVVGLIW